FLFFRLGEDELGLELHHVREILRYMPVARVPGSPAWLAGVINVRGKVLPVIDFGVRLGLAPAVVGKRTCIVILDLDLGLSATVAMGLLVDSVNRVDDVDTANVQAPPRFGLRVHAEHVIGLIRRGDNMHVLVDVVRAFAGDELLDAARSAEPAAIPPPAAPQAPPAAPPAAEEDPGVTEFAPGIWMFAET
ncbi:MAG TPA: chemotaxis protein CheW, partial [Kofleriaceae bacterium]|nr:chemotaxis protein CheW [Kofleriaceae bacterium]